MCERAIKKNFQDNISFSLIKKIGSAFYFRKLDKKKVYKILAKYGGRNLVGKKNEISPGIFWSMN